MRRTLSYCAITTVLFSWDSAFAADYTPILMTGQAAPGVPGGIIASVGSAGITSDGRVMVRGRLSLSGVDSSALWLNDGSAMSLVARDSTAAPGGSTYGPMGWFEANSTGQVAFRSTSLYAGQPGSLNKVATYSGQAIGLPAGNNFSNFGPITLNDNGQVAFYAQTQGTSGSGTGIWSGPSNNVQSIAYSGMAAPGTGNTFAGFNAVTASNTGAIFWTYLNVANSQSLWLAGGGTLSSVVRQQQQAAGLPSGVNYASFSASPSMNNAGQIAFDGSITGSGITSSNNRVIWAGTPSSLGKIVQSGEAATGLASGVILTDVYSPLISGGGNLVYRASLGGTGVSTANDTAMYLRTGGITHLLAREGDLAPGTNVQFKSWYDPTLSSSGAGIFLGYLKGTGVTPDNEEGIWYSDASGNVSLIARMGESIDLGGGDLRVIGDLEIASFSGGEDRQWKGLSEDGTAVFYAWFTDGTSAILMNTVPEPAALVVGMGLLSMLMRRRRPVTPARSPMGYFKISA